MKRCGCTHPTTGKRLGPTCPQLRRSGGGWSATHGTWCLQLELPTPPGTGRRQFRRSGFPTKDAAQEVLDQARELLALAPRDRDLTYRIANLLAELPARHPIPTPQAVVKKLRAGGIAGVTITVADYLDTWITARQGLSGGTLHSYQTHIDAHLKPHLGHLGIHELQPVHVQDMFTAIEDDNQRILAARRDQDLRDTVRGVRTVGPTTKHRIRATLRKACADAIKTYKLIQHNPAVPIELPAANRPRARAWNAKAIATWKATGRAPSPVMVWMPDQAAAFLDHTETHDPACYPLYALITVWGLRRGEACGLRDIDIDLETGVVTIVQQRTAVDYQPVVKTVKSAAGERTLMIDTHTTAILRSYLALRARWQLAAGPAWPGTGFFFVRPDGQPWHPDHISRHFEYLTRKAALPPIRLHDLRHCAASYLKLAGADMKTIQETLGHSSIVITADTYTTLFADLSRTTTEAAANLIHQQRRKKTA